MRKKQESNPRKTIRIAVTVGIVIVALVIAVSYIMDQANLKGKQFGDNLAWIQSDLKNETKRFDTQLTNYEKGNMTRDEMLNITDAHITKMKDILSRYDTLDAPKAFSSSLQLFRSSTQKQLQSDELLKKWVQTGNITKRQMSDELLQQSFQDEMNALRTFHDAKSNGS